jgi:hypothetical protein
VAREDVLRLRVLPTLMATPQGVRAVMSAARET